MNSQPFPSSPRPRLIHPDPAAPRLAARALAAAALALVALAIAVLALAPAARAASWLAPTALSPDGPAALEPQLAVDPGGDAVAVWEARSGSTNAIEAAVRPAGSSAWSAAVQLSDAPDQATLPRVAIDAHGDAVAVWQLTTTHDAVEAASYSAASGEWAAPVLLSNPGRESVAPEVAVDPAGHAIVVWAGDNAAGTSIADASTEASVGGPWSAPAEVSEPGQNADSPTVTFGSSGNVVAAWRRWNGADFVVQAAERVSGGAWTVPVNLSEPAQNAHTPTVGVDAQGDAVVAWARWNGAHEMVQAATKLAGGAWGVAKNVSSLSDNSYTPTVAFDGGRNATLAWEREAAGGWTVQVASEPVGSGTWGAPATISAASADQPEPSLAVDAGGDAAASWQAKSGAIETVFAARRPAGGAWSAPAPLSQPSIEARLPQVGLDGEGDELAVWKRFDGSSAIAEAAAYDATPPLLSGVSIPASGVTGQALSFSAANADRFSSPGPTSWSFGDGASATGAGVTHAFGAPGTYPVTVTGTDAAGNSASVSGTVVVAPAPVAKAKPACRAGLVRRKVKVRVRVGGHRGYGTGRAKSVFKTKTVWRCVKPGRAHHKKHRAPARKGGH